MLTVVFAILVGGYFILCCVFAVTLFRVRRAEKKNFEATGDRARS